MKFKAQDYINMGHYLKPVLAKHSELSRDSLLTSMRQRWDIFWEAFDPVIKEGKFNQIFNDYNDTHIDTAIKAIIRECYQ